MNTPSKASIKFAKESSERIGKIEIQAEPNFYSYNSEKSNSVDEDFVRALENGEDLTDEYVINYINE